MSRVLLVLAALILLAFGGWFFLGNNDSTPSKQSKLEESISKIQDEKLRTEVEGRATAAQEDSNQSIKDGLEEAERARLKDEIRRMRAQLSSLPADSTTKLELEKCVAELDAMAVSSESLPAESFPEALRRCQTIATTVIEDEKTTSEEKNTAKAFLSFLGMVCIIAGIIFLIYGDISTGAALIGLGAQLVSGQGSGADNTQKGGTQATFESQSGQPEPEGQAAAIESVRQGKIPLNTAMPQGPYFFLIDNSTFYTYRTTGPQGELLFSVDFNTVEKEVSLADPENRPVSVTDFGVGSTGYSVTYKASLDKVMALTCVIEADPTKPSCELTARRIIEKEVIP